MDIIQFVGHSVEFGSAFVMMPIVSDGTGMVVYGGPVELPRAGVSVDGKFVDGCGNSVVVSIFSVVVCRGVGEVAALVCHDGVVFSEVDVEDGMSVVGHSIVGFGLIVLSDGDVEVTGASTDVEFPCAEDVNGGSSDGPAVVKVASSTDAEIVVVDVSVVLVLVLFDDPVVLSLVIAFSVVVVVASGTEHS